MTTCILVFSASIAFAAPIDPRYEYGEDPLAGMGVQTDNQSSQGSQTTGFGNPIAEDTIEGILARIMGYLKGIAGTIAVIFIIIGGIMYMISAGNKEMAERAKKTVTLALAGLAIVAAAPTFYKEIMTILGGSTSNIGGLSFQQIALNVLRLLLSIVGFLAIITMIIGSIWMFSAAGDQDRYEMGKKTVMYSLVGIIIAVGALILVNQVIELIGGHATSTPTTEWGDYGPERYGTESEGHVPESSTPTGIYDSGSGSDAPAQSVPNSVAPAPKEW